MIYELIISSKCNWNCYYCNFPPHKTIDLSISYIKYNYTNIFNYIDKSDNIIIISGGEIGLLKYELLKYIIEYFSYAKVIVNTNGIFLEKKYHKTINNISEIYYHAVENTSDLVKCKKYDDNRILNGIVGEIETLYDFISYNKHMFFHYVDIETKNKNFTYNNKIKKEIKKLLELDNVNKEYIFFNILKRKDIKIARLNCLLNKEKYSILLNLTTNKIYKCLMYNFHLNLELTLENLKSVKFNNINDVNCDYCFRKCF